MIDYKRDSIAVWMGFSKKPLDEWLKYTNGLENPRRKPPIKKDFGDGFIDVDFFGYHSVENDDVISVDELVKEVGSNSIETDHQIIEQAKKLGITKGNRLYYHCNAVFYEEKAHQLYNDLTFIGNFNDPYPE